MNKIITIGLLLTTSVFLNVVFTAFAEDVNPTVLNLCESYGGTWNTISNDCDITDEIQKTAYETAYEAAYQAWKKQIDDSRQEVEGGFCVLAGCD